MTAPVIILVLAACMQRCSIGQLLTLLLARTFWQFKACLPSAGIVAYRGCVAWPFGIKFGQVILPVRSVDPDDRGRTSEIRLGDSWAYQRKGGFSHENTRSVLRQPDCGGREHQVTYLLICIVTYPI